MKKLPTRNPLNTRPQRGAVLIIVAAALVVLLGFAALAVDLGALYSARTQLQSGADAAALAAVSEIDSGQATTAAAEFASFNTVMDTPITLDPADIVTGSLDFSTGTFTPGGQPSNAVKVIARRTDGSPDGPLPLFFGRVLGRNAASVEAESVAAIDSRISGVRPANAPGQIDLLPFAVKKSDVGHTETITSDGADPVNFHIDPTSGAVNVFGTTDIHVTVLGTQITYGAGGPTIPVTAAVSIDGGQTYYDIPSAGDTLTGGETLSFTGIEEAQIAVRARATYMVDDNVLFDSTRISNVASPYVIVLRQGDIAPAYPGFDGQEEVTSFLAPYIDPDSREITIGENDAIFLYEFANDLTSQAADFQDLVVLCSFLNAEQTIAQSDTRFVPHIGATIDFYPYYDLDAPGNFGLVSLDGCSNGASTLSDWILNGYPGTFNIPVDPGYIVLNGCPGVTTSIKHAVSERIGDTVLVTVYDDVTGQGDNAWYRIPFFVALRIESVNLTGAPENRHIRATVLGLRTSNLITTPGAPEHAGLGTQRLAR